MEKKKYAAYGDVYKRQVVLVCTGHRYGSREIGRKIMEKEKLKIYHVLTDRNIGGAGRWLLNYLKYCNREKYDVRVVLPADSQLCPVVESLDIPVIKMDAMADSSYDKKALAPLTCLLYTS